MQTKLFLRPWVTLSMKLELLGNIAQVKVHYQVLIQAKWCSHCCLCDVHFGYWYLMVCFYEVTAVDVAAS